MKAALYTEPHRITIVERDLRPLQQGEALVQIHACGICGTDLHIIEGTSHSRPPVVLGHEFAGLVLDLAGEYPVIRVGTRVAVDPNICCGVCYYCRRGSVHLCSNLTALGVDRDGGMAEFCIVPVQQLHVLPDTLPLEAGALVEPVSCALHGIDRAGIRVGDSVVIIGGGTIGLLMLQLARHAGATRIVVVEPAEHKRKAADTLGAHATLDPRGMDIRSAVFDLTSVGADVVLECAGSTASAELAVQLARRGGSVVFFGVCPRGETFPISPHDVYARELTIAGSYINPYTFARAIEVIASGIVSIEALSPALFSLEELPQALKALRDGRTIKNILQPQRS